jgi:Dehydrogenases with different specificities (related to short-chain alcohol dehydrogenases)
MNTNNTLLSGEAAIVTGASCGIGLATAELFVQHGAKVLLNGRDEKTLQAACARINAQHPDACSYLAGDAADMQVPQQLFDAAMSRYQRLDITICCAGTAARTPTLDESAAQWNHVIQVNATAAMLLAQLSLRHFAKQRSGKLVFVSSTAAKSVNLGASPSYGASKAMLVYLTRHYAAEFAPYGVNVNAICPGATQTEIITTWTPEHRQRVLDALPMGRMDTAQEMAQAILYLSSPHSDYVNGESMMINGARFMD